MYNIVIRQFYKLLNAHRTNIITVLLTFIMVYFSALWLMYFVTSNLYLLIPFTYFANCNSQLS